MATSKAQPAITMNPSAPEVSAATKFAVSVSATEFNLGFGRTRSVFQANGEALATGIEYTHAFSISPIAAKQLTQILAMSIMQYEKAFGTIPEDPAVIKKLSEMSKSGTQRAPSKKPAARRSAPKAK